MPDDEELEVYEVLLTDEAFYTYASIPSERVFEHVGRDLKLLEASPELGRAYDPAYDARRPPFACRVLYCEHYGIYYRIDDASRSVLVFAIEDQRRNPEMRFSHYEYAIARIEAAEQ